MLSGCGLDSKECRSRLRAFPADGFEHGSDLGIGHEQAPAQAGAGVLNHGDDWSLVDGKILIGIPVAIEIEGILETKLAPQALAVGEVEMLQTGERFRWRVRHGADGRRGRDGAVVVLARGTVVILVRSHAGGESPERFAVALVLAGILDGVGSMNQRGVAIVLEVIAEAVALVAWVEADEGILRKEQGAAHGIAPDGLSETVILLTVDIIFRPGPAFVVAVRRDRMRGRSNRQQVGDHGFVPAGHPRIFLPTKFRRPVPVERLAARRLEEPIPLDGFPKVGGSLPYLRLDSTRLIEILPHSEHALHEECGLDDVRAVVIRRERQGLARGPMNPMREGTVIAIRFLFQKREHRYDSMGHFISRRKASLRSYHQGKQAKASATRRTRNAIVGALADQAAARICVVPEVAKRGFLHRCEQLRIRHRATARGDGDGRRTLLAIGKEARDSIAVSAVICANEVAVKIRAMIRCDGNKRTFGPVSTLDRETLPSGGHRQPMQVDATGMTFRGECLNGIGSAGSCAVVCLCLDAATRTQHCPGAKQLYDARTNPLNSSFLEERKHQHLNQEWQADVSSLPPASAVPESDTAILVRPVLL